MKPAKPGSHASNDLSGGPHSVQSSRSGDKTAGSRARTASVEKGESANRTRDRNAGGLVYSTEAGRMCPVCRHPIGACGCKAAAAAAQRSSGDGIARVSRETKGRAGKGVTLVRGLPLADDALSALARQLRSACGAGGTVKEGVVEIQGDHCERVVDWLRAQGHLVKRAGG